ncbi:MAG: tetratricopeptide repeat protein [Limisphaerales bacterium]
MNLKPRLQYVPGALAIIALTFLVYSPLIPGTFLMDDARLSGWDNPLVNGELTLRSLWFGTDFTLTTFVWWLEHLAFGAHPAGYHVINIILQALGALLLWQLLAQLRIPGGWLAGALFAAHPVCVNSVARIAELKNTLSLPFFLLSFLAYLHYERLRLYPPIAPARHRERGGALWYFVSLMAFILGLMAKTTIVMLPVALLLCAAWQRRQIRWRDLIHLAPYFALSLAFGLMSIWFQKYQAIPTSPLALHHASFARRLAGAGYDFWFYLGKALFPFGLNLEYRRWNINALTPANFLPDLLVAVLFLVCLFFRRSWGRHALFGLGCYAVVLFPALGFFNAQFEMLWQVSDHLQYTALPAVLALIAAAAAASHGVTFRSLAVILIAVCSMLSFKWAAAFRNEEKLMAISISKNPQAWASLNDLGVVYANENDYAKAIPKFEQSVKYNPNDTDARLNLGYALLMQKNYNGAQAQYLAILKNNPRQAVANKMYGRLLELEGQQAKAIRHYQISVCLSPDIDTCLDLATLDYTSGNWGRVVTDLRLALSLKPDPARELPALNNLAWVLATCPESSVRNGLEAIRYARTACRLTGFKQSGPVNTLAAAYAEAGRFTDAVTTAEMAARLATKAGDAQSAATIQKLLAQYQAGRPCRESKK